MYLLADIGGTHTRLCVAGDATLGEVEVFENADFADLATLAGAFLADRAVDPGELHGRFAVACPVEGDCIRLTNLDWRFSIAALRERLRLRELRFCNDFSALALALPWLQAEDLIQIGDGTPVHDYPKVVLGPGTGLGVSSLVPHKGDWVSVAGEGGHVSFAPRTEIESRLLGWLWQRFEHASAERVLAGPGLALVYEGIGELEGGAGTRLAPREVVERARAGETLARRTLDVYFAMLGSVAGDLALTLGARGGVYLAGGILPRNVEALKQSRFREAFAAKGRLRDFLAQIPSFLIVHPYPALLGLLHARRLPRA